MVAFLPDSCMTTSTQTHQRKRQVVILEFQKETLYSLVHDLGVTAKDLMARTRRNQLEKLAKQMNLFIYKYCLKFYR